MMTTEVESHESIGRARVGSNPRLRRGARARLSVLEKDRLSN